MNSMRVMMLLCTAAALACGEVSAPVPPAAPLGAVLDEYAHPFTGPVRLAELRDGRALAMDAREGRLEVIDFVTDTGVVAAGRGDGPLEQRSGHVIVRAPSDSLWVFDIVRGRVLVFAPDGRAVRGFDATYGGGRVARMSKPWLANVDADGNWYGRVRAMTLTREGGGFADSVAVVRVRAESGAQDTLAMLLAEGARRKSPTGATRLTAFDPFDASAVFSDGRVLVLRGESYTPEVVLPDGRVQRGAPIAHARVRTSPAEVRMMVDSTQRATAALLSMFLANGPVRPGAESPSMEVVAPDPLPESWPVLVEDAAMVDTRQRAWVAVRDSARALEGQRYDLLDRDGRWVTAVRLPLRMVLVGFGRDVVYVARRDDDDLLWLGRYPLP
jgi:hypothetical protein